MTSRAELAPLFTDIKLSADDVNAIAAALYDVAKSDGEHGNEIEMIRELLQTLDADLGAAAPTQLPAMSPDKLALAVTDPAARKVAISCAVLLAWADGSFSDKERAAVTAYANALDLSPAQYQAIETTVTSWVQSGDPTPLF